MSTPEYGSLVHSEIKELFIKCINIIQPEHPYKKNVYPVKESDVMYSYKKNSSSMYASCGPKGGFYSVSFSADRNYLNSCEPERVLAIFTHEVTHVTVGTHSSVEHGAHPPRFWRECGFNAHIMLDKWDMVKDIFGDMTRQKYIGYIVSAEVNLCNVDRRYSQVKDQRQKVANWFKNTLQDR